MAELERVLSYRSILLITINSILGTGIFFLPAIGAAQSGAASIWAWVIMGGIAIIMSMVFAELVGMYPQSGGVYEFAKKAFNQEVSFFVGFLTLIVSYVTIAMLIVGAVNYLIPHAPFYLTTAVALVLILLFHIVAYTGMQTSAVMLIAFAIITLSILATMIVGSFMNFSWANFATVMNTCAGKTSCAPVGALFATVFLIAETFFGWETATFLAGETKNGRKVVPKALLVGTVLMVCIALLLVVGAIGGAGPEGLANNVTSPFSFMTESFFGESFVPVANLLVYLAIIGSVAGWVVSSPRLIGAMAEDKLFLSQLSKVHPRFKTPSNAIIFQGILVGILIVVSASSYKLLLELLIPLVLLQYSIVIVTLVALRYKEPNEERTFRFPGASWLPLLILPVFVFFTYMWSSHAPGAVRILILALSLLLMGAPLFLLLKVYYDPSFFIKLNDLFAWFVYMTEKINMPREVINEILLLLGNVESKQLLEYGCSVGTLTVQLADRVSPTGRIIATNISSKELAINRKRIKRMGHEHVVFLHDEHQVNRVHPDIPTVDVVVSIGMLSALQDAQKVLHELSDLVARGGKIVMVDYTNYFHIIPDKEYMNSDATIVDMFRKAGFAVSVTRRKGKFWNYVYIHGIKTDKEYTNHVYI